MKSIKYIIILILLIVSTSYASWYYGVACSYTEKDENYTGNLTDETNGNLGNGETDESCGFNILTTSSYYAYAMTVRMKRVGDPTGLIYAYIYDPDNGGAEGPPDDRLATSETTLDVSTISTDCTDYIFYFASPILLATATYYDGVIFFDRTTSDASNSIIMCGDLTIGAASGRYSQEAAPGVTDDSGNWATDDTDGQGVYKTWQCE